MVEADELKRRLVHAGGAVFPGLYLAELVTWGQLRVIYFAGILVAIGLETARLVFGLDWWLFQELTRDYEERNLAGYALYTFGSAVTILAFRPRVAVPAVLMLALADPVSGYLSAGELRRVKRPRVLGATFGVCLGIAVVFVPLGVAVAASLIATAADGVKPVIRGYVIDDNITIPLGAAIVLWLGLEGGWFA